MLNWKGGRCFRSNHFLSRPPCMSKTCRGSILPQSLPKLGNTDFDIINRIACLSLSDALSRLKEATRAPARVGQPDNTWTSIDLSEISIDPPSTCSEGKPLESPNNSQPDSLESLIEQSNGLELAQEELCSQSKVPRGAFNRLERKRQGILEKLRKNFLRKARRGMFEWFRTQSLRESSKSNF